jgi:hypothetical protein
MRESSSVRYHDIGIWVATSSLLLIIGAGLEKYYLALQDNHGRGNCKLFGIISMLQVLAGTIAAFASISLHRRPQIKRGSKTVDAQNTCSAFDRSVWQTVLSWPLTKASIDIPFLGLDPFSIRQRQQANWNLRIFQN